MCEVERDRETRVYAARHRVLLGRENSVTVVRILTGLAEDRLVDKQLWHVARGAADLFEHLTAAVDGGHLRRGQRVDEIEFLQFEQGRRPWLGGKVDSQDRLISDGELIRHTVEVPIHVVTDDLHRLHTELVVGCTAIEVANERDAALPLERLDHEVRIRGVGILGVGREVDSLHAGGVEDHYAGDAGTDAAQDAKGDPLRTEKLRLRHSRARARFGPELLAILVQFLRHLLSQPLDRPRREQVRRVALDELRDDFGTERIAMNVPGWISGPVLERPEMACGTGCCVGSGDPDRSVIEPLARSLYTSRGFR
jgi:hypothetical protein